MITRSRHRPLHVYDIPYGGCHMGDAIYIFYRLEWGGLFALDPNLDELTLQLMLNFGDTILVHFHLHIMCKCNHFDHDVIS